MDINLDAPLNAVQQQKTATQGLLSGQLGQTNDFLGRYNNALGSQEKTGALATRLGNELGLPQLQTNANMLRDTVTNLPGTYSKATTGFDVNANQLQRVIGQKTSEIAPAMDTAERALTNAQNTLNTRLGYETRDQDRALMPFDREQSFLSDRMARETSLYSQDNQHELDALLDKVRNGITLSEGEKNRAQQLAIAEKGYQNELDKVKAAQTGTGGGSGTNPYMSVGEGNVVFDPQTGQVIYKNAKTYAPSGGGSQITPTLNNAGSFNWSQYRL